ncbi:DUF1735 domain-containing protein [uncultured Mucilaginibacter sp.]|uniref:DUF1735 domain-containing protein n=1 Tax=uncultured Mucilaginibacter sp. TaxID=797541 RepID=UPI002638B73B|nr:DUF1735 domain-containing protein [uncultured Mucilaginibacter sp.]
MKKIIFALAILTATLTSCLKDKPNVDFSNLGVNVDLVESGLTYFPADAITSTADTITKTFTVNISSPNTLSTDEVVTIGVDNSIITSYNATNTSVTYNAIPAAAFKLPTTSLTIKAGQRVGTFSVTIYKNQLDPALSYMLPIKIVSVSTGTISGNFGVHYYHIIGNDFAGSYKWNFKRYNASDTTSTAPASQSFTGNPVTISPVSPTQIEVTSGYYYMAKYEVTFTKTGNGASASYSNFAVTLNKDDVAKAAGLGVTLNTPSFVLIDPTKSYTYAQVLQKLKFIYIANTSSGNRVDVDTYYK